MSGPEPTGDGPDLDGVLERLSYAPDQVDPERVLDRLSGAAPPDRLRIAAAIGRTSPETAAALGDTAPILVGALDLDLGPRRRHLLRALETIAAADPAAVKPYADRLRQELRAYNFWVGQAATATWEHLVAAYPDAAGCIVPLLDADDSWVRTRAAAVLSAATTDRRAVDGRLLEACVDAVADGRYVGPAAIDVLANAGWFDPAALEPAVDDLHAAARTAEHDARVAALSALGHVAGHDPALVRDELPLYVDLTTADREAVARAAATLVVAVALQESAALDRVRELVERRSYFDRATTVRGIDAASRGLPGRETLFAAFVGDDSGFIRRVAYRQSSPVDR